MNSMELTSGVVVEREYLHKPEYCMMESCTTEAGYWVPFRDSASQQETFYLCDEHMETLAGCDDEGSVRAEYARLWPEENHIEMVEIGVYSCSEDCAECNR